MHAAAWEGFFLLKAVYYSIVYVPHVFITLLPVGTGLAPPCDNCDNAVINDVGLQVSPQHLALNSFSRCPEV